MPTRRKFLRIGAATALLVPLASLGLYSLRDRLPLLRKLSVREQDVISQLVYILLPGDEIAPDALSLGVETQLIAQAYQDPALRRLFKRGLRWIEKWQMDTTASELTSAQDGVHRYVMALRHAETAPYHQLESRFFRRIRDLSFEYYYSHPQSWRALSYPHPPQPLGFMDYHLPPSSAQHDA